LLTFAQVEPFNPTRSMFAFRCLRSLTASLFALLLAAAPVSAQGILAGTVLDGSNGLNLTGAVVRIDACVSSIFCEVAFASKMGVPVKPTKVAPGSASRRCLAKPYL
jgi:hypothetical protein